jgi:hypothetical protein
MNLCFLYKRGSHRGCVHFVHFLFTSSFTGEVNSKNTPRQRGETSLFTSFTSSEGEGVITLARCARAPACRTLMQGSEWSERSEREGLTPEPSVDFRVHFMDISEVNRSEQSEREVMSQ